MAPTDIPEVLTEEAARIRRFPGIAFRGDDADRRAWVIGTGLDVWQIIEALEDASSVEDLLRTTDLGARHVRLATAYHQSHPDEIADAIAENNRPLDELRELFPFVAVESID